MMFGYATNETENYMPLSLDLAHRLLQTLAEIRREGKVMTYLRPDSKSQVTMEYDELTGKPVRVHTIVVSTQHDEFIMPSSSLSEKEAERLMQEQICHHHTLTTDYRQLLQYYVRENKCCGHELTCLVACITEHNTLIASTLHLILLTLNTLIDI